MQILGVYSDYVKVKECIESKEEIVRTYNDTDLSTTAKVVEIAAQGTFITTQAAEFEYRKDPSIAPVVYSINGVADIVKIGVHAHIRQEDLKETAIKIGIKAITHAGETLMSLNEHPRFKTIPGVQETYTAIIVLGALAHGAVLAYNYVPWNKVFAKLPWNRKTLNENSQITEA